jgi:hypothetical protein
MREEGGDHPRRNRGLFKAFNRDDDTRALHVPHFLWNAVVGVVRKDLVDWSVP